MRILAISHIFPHAENAHHGIFAARQFAGLRQQGADVTVFFSIVKIPKFLSFYKEKWRNYNQKHAPIPYGGLDVIQIPYIRLTRGFGSCRWEGRALFHAMKKRAIQLHDINPFDVIYGRGLFPCADAAAHLSRCLKIPAVGAGIGDDVNTAPYYSPIMYRHFLKLLERLDGIVANGRGVAEKISSLSGKECPTMHGVVDLDIFHPARDKNLCKYDLKFPPHSLVLLFVGALLKEKGVFELIEAFNAAHRNLPNIVLKICGQGGELHNLERRIKELQLANHVCLLGTVDPADMHKWMQASDIFLLPTYNEGMPNVVMEAMACGLPIISTAVGGLPEAVGDSKGAILIEPRSSEQLASAIKKVGTDKTLREQMGWAARQTAEQKFGARANSQKLLAYLGSVIAQYKPHAEIK